MDHYFGILSPQMSQFRTKLLNVKSYVCAERAKITTNVYRETLDKPMVIRWALMYKNVLERMSISIEDETLLAGNHASRNGSTPVFPEYAMDWVIAELDEF
jgi:formate C-acetyltransferase